MFFHNFVIILRQHNYTARKFHKHFISYLHVVTLTTRYFNYYVVSWAPLKMKSKTSTITDHNTVLQGLQHISKEGIIISSLPYLQLKINTLLLCNVISIYFVDGNIYLKLNSKYFSCLSLYFISICRKINRENGQQHTKQWKKCYLLF